MARQRTIARSAAVVAFVVIGLASLGPLLTIPLVAWLSETTIIRVLQFPERDIHHLLHGVGAALLYGALLICVAVQLRQPRRWVAPLWLASFIILTQILIDLRNGTVGDPVWWVVYALFAAVVVLHPRRTAGITATDRPAALLAAAAAVPLVVHAWNQLQLQLQFGPEDPTGHVAGNHYVGMAVLAGTIIVGVLLGSTDAPGNRLVAWIAGGAAVLLGIASFAHPGQASAPATGWAAAAVVWGGAHVIVGAGRRRRDARIGRAPTSSDSSHVLAGR